MNIFKVVIDKNAEKKDEKESKQFQLRGKKGMAIDTCKPLK